MEAYLIEKKWLEPGRELFQLATELLKAVEKEKYAFLNHSIDFTWFGICNTTAKKAHTGASMMSPGLTQEGNGGFSEAWTSSYIPALKALIKKYEVSHKEEAKKLKNKLDEITKKMKN